jgi:hypothetical protein
MSMSGYTKLFNSILASTIWRENDKTRLVWITLLAMSDKDGICEGSVPGLADFARVTVAECEAALEVLSSPDKYSRTSEHEGRRIETLDGTGWRLLNHAKYRAKMSEDERREYNRQKQAEHRAKLKAETVNDSQTLSNGVNDGQSQSAESAHEDTDAEAEAHTKKEGEPDSALPHPPTATSFEPDRWQNPAVIIFEEIFGFKTGSGFASSIVKKVLDLETWTALLENKRAYADQPLAARKKICTWILDEYDKRIPLKTPINGNGAKPSKWHHDVP